jgi:long-subunit acyl-CoA synthetase (AMP-forming)
MLAQRQPQHPALIAGAQTLCYAQLLVAVDRLAAHFQELGIGTLALYADNRIGWIVADLAAQAAGICCVPLPRFFSDGQLQHVLRDSGADAILTNECRFDDLPGWRAQATPAGMDAWLLLRRATGAAARLPAGTQKITYTSGTTGTPKGVCLSAASQLAVARSLARASDARPADRHLCLLPLATLLENIGGVYAPLLAGASVCVLGQAEVGMDGAAGLRVGDLVASLQRQQATTTILVPQLLSALVEAGEAGLRLSPTLRFVAVGGAPVSARLLERAQRLGVPVFEGYGLSESASVVALNTAGAHRPGSVGRVLPHLRLRFAADGEILVRGAGFLGYCGDQSQGEEWVATGDIGHLDDDGFLYLDGRKKSMFITAFGRNVAPEWVERELIQQPAIAQAAVFGEGRPWNVAVIVPRACSSQDVAAAIAAANRDLPDYARVRCWLVADRPFTPANGLLTANGRVRHDAVVSSYRARIDALYRQDTPVGLTCSANRSRATDLTATVAAVRVQPA